MPDNARTVLTVFIAMTALIGFAALVGYGLYQTWLATDAAPSFTEAYLYVATALTGLVGGIVAAGFGQKSPDPGSQAAASGPKPPASSLKAQPRRMARSLTGVGGFALAGRGGNAKQFVGTVYAAVYLVVGVAAVATWVSKSSVTPELVKNLALVVIGLALPTVGAIMSD